MLRFPRRLAARFGALVRADPSGVRAGFGALLISSGGDLVAGLTLGSITHTLDSLPGLLVLVPGGRVAFYGPPSEGLTFFGKSSWAEVFQAFDREPGRDWATEFQVSPICAQYVVSGLDGGIAGNHEEQRVGEGGDQQDQNTQPYDAAPHDADHSVASPVRGSSASRRESPTRLNAIVVERSAMPGTEIIQGAVA